MKFLLTKKIYSEFRNSNEIKTHILTNHLRPIIRTPIPKAYHNLIERCWDENPSKRPSFEEIITELRTNPEFITDSVDKEEYQKYIKYIDDSPKLFKSDQKIQQLEEFVNCRLCNYDEIEIKMNLQSIYETETNNILLETKFINLKNFEKPKLIYNEREYKVFDVLDKNTNKLYIAKQFTSEIKSIYRDY